MLSHSVFFTLHDNSPAAVERLVTACKTHLSGHAAQVLCRRNPRRRMPTGGQRSRFRRGAARGLRGRRPCTIDYQQHPRHLRFIEENRENSGNTFAFSTPGWSYAASRSSHLLQLHPRHILRQSGQHCRVTE